MKKVLSVLVVLLVLSAIGCAPNLVSYPPTMIDSQIVKGVEELKLPPQVPEGHYRVAIENSLKQSRNAIAIYEEMKKAIADAVYFNY